MNYIKLISVINLFIVSASSLFGMVASSPYTDKDLLEYANSEYAFRGTVWLEPHCSASRVKITDNDQYDFYVTAAHCVEDEEVRYGFNDEVYDFRRNSSQLDESDVVQFSELKCVIHEEYLSSEPICRDGECRNSRHQDLALCSNYSKRKDLPRYKIKFVDEFEDKAMLHGTAVGFGSRGIVQEDSLQNLVPERQASNQVFCVDKEFESFSNFLCGAFHKNHVDNPIDVAGALSFGDSGGSLLMKDDRGQYFLIGTTQTDGAWTGISREFLFSAYGELTNKD